MDDRKTEPTDEQRAIGRHLRYLADQLMAQADALDPRPIAPTANDTARVDWLDRYGVGVRRRDKGSVNLVVWGRGGLRRAIDEKRTPPDEERTDDR